MISKIFKNSQRIVSLNQSWSQNFASGQKGGNLYTWGQQVAGLGYQPKSATQSLDVPQKIEAFDNNVAKVVMGPNHTAVITTEGELYTFGFGPALGHGQSSSVVYTPKRVEFFANSGLKVKDVAVGEHHTLALTENNEVYSWGKGAGNTNFLLNLFKQASGALGHSTNVDRLIPTAIDALQDNGPFKHITAGNQFSLAVNNKGELLHWGKAKQGVFGDGSHIDVATPTVNEHFAELKSQDNLSVVKVQSVGDASVALLSNGKLYSWGANTQGQLGQKHDIGAEHVEVVPVPEEVVDEHLHGKKVTDFQLSENILVALTEDGQVYYAGMRNNAVLEKLEVNGKVKKISASHDSVALLLDNNNVLTHFTFLPFKDQDLQTGLLHADTSFFEGGEILELGGPYRTRYAIVKN